MITRTVGIGGDFSDWVAVVTYLNNSNRGMNLIDTSFKFTQISDIVQAGNATHPLLYASANVDIEIDGGGFLTTTGGAGIRMNVWTGDTYVSLKAHDLVIDMTYDYWSFSGYQIGIMFTGRRSIEIYGNKVYSLLGSGNKNSGIFIRPPLTGYLKLYSNIIFGLGGNGLEINGNVSSSTNPVMAIENNTIYDCGTYTGHYGIAIYATGAPSLAGNKNFKNNAVIRVSPNTFQDVLQSTDQESLFLNCAFSYSSLSGVPSGNIVGCSFSQTTAVFLSTDPTSDDFLRPTPASVLQGSGMDPSVAVVDFYGAQMLSPYPIGALQNTPEPEPDRWGKASDYLIQQYKDGLSVPNLVDMHGERLMAIANNVDIMMPKLLSITDAEGEQLNNIGKTVDAGRGVLSDIDYRLLILFMQKVNAAGGNPAIIIEYIREYLGSYFSYLLFDEGNAAVNIQLMTEGVLPSGFISGLVYQLSRIVPAAVEVRLFHSEDGEIFAVADEGTDVTVGAGFSEDKDEPYTGRTTGGQFVDPIKI